MRTQFYNIKYPFTNDSPDNYFIDLNRTYRDKCRSDIVHLIFTPKGQRLRDPDFGTDLIKYIFEVSESMTWSGVSTSIKDAVSRFLPHITLNNIEIVQSEDSAHDILVRLDFAVNRGYQSYTDSIIIPV